VDDKFDPFHTRHSGSFVEKASWKQRSSCW
jgi:hypothetical protein